MKTPRLLALLAVVGTLAACTCPGDEDLEDVAKADAPAAESSDLA